MNAPRFAPVEAGQVWSFRDYVGFRVTFTVDRVERTGVLRAFGTSTSGRQVSLEVETMREGRRGARLERLADGTPAAPPSRPSPRRDAEPMPEPARRVCELRPRGLPRAEPTEIEDRVRELHQRGFNRREIGEHLGLTTRQVLSIDERMALRDSVARLRSA